VQRLVSFKFQRPQITVVTNHPCYDTVTLNPNNETKLHGIAVVLLYDELTGSSWGDGRTPVFIVPYITTRYNYTEHSSGPYTAVGLLRVCVRAITFELNDLW